MRSAAVAARRAREAMAAAAAEGVGGGPGGAGGAGGGAGRRRRGGRARRRGRRRCRWRRVGQRWVQALGGRGCGMSGPDWRTLALRLADRVEEEGERVRSALLLAMRFEE